MAWGGVVGEGRAGSGDLIVIVGPGMGLSEIMPSPGEGILV